MLSHFLRAVPSAAAAPIDQPIYIGRTTAGITGNNQCTLSVPSGTVVGDLLVVTTCAPQPTSANQTTPAGWVERLDSAGRFVASFVWDGVASSYTFTSTATGTLYPGVMMAFRNAVFDQMSTLSAAAEDPVAPSITISRSQAIQVVVGGTTNAGSNTHTQTSGFTEIADLNTESPVKGCLAVQYRINQPAGSTGTVTYATDGTTAGNGRAWQFSIIPKTANNGVVFLGGSRNQTDLANYTFSGVNFGSAADNREIFVVAQVRHTTTGTIDSITIGGVSATVNSYTSPSPPIKFLVARAVVPTGTSGTIEINTSQVATSCTVFVFSVTRATPNATLTDSVSTAAASGATSYSTSSLTTNAGGVSFGLISKGATGTYTYSGVGVVSVPEITGTDTTQVLGCWYTDNTQSSVSVTPSISLTWVTSTAYGVYGAAY